MPLELETTNYNDNDGASSSSQASDGSNQANDGRSQPVPFDTGSGLEHIPLPRRPARSLSGMDHLVIVCCHAIWKGYRNPPHTDGLRASEWITESFQVDEQATFKRHINMGLAIASRSPTAIVVFSGGATRQRDTHDTEANSYLKLAERMMAAEDRPVYWNRLLTESYATDSYQNLLFSIVRFYQHTGRWPEHITIVSHAFKEQRFLDRHRRAIRWPAPCMDFQGADPPSFDEDSEARTRDRFEADPHGLSDPLSSKRVNRGWRQADLINLLNERQLPAEVQRLLNWNGGPTGSAVFPSEWTLPWDEHSIIFTGGEGDGSSPPPQPQQDPPDTPGSSPDDSSENVNSNGDRLHGGRNAPNGHPPNGQQSSNYHTRGALTKDPGSNGGSPPDKGQSSSIPSGDRELKGVPINVSTSPGRLAYGEIKERHFYRRKSLEWPNPPPPNARLLFLTNDRWTPVGHLVNGRLLDGGL